MQFLTPLGDVTFSIPDDWWEFSEVANCDFSAGGGYSPPAVGKFKIAELRDIAPPERATKELSFRKYKLMPVLFAFASPECALPLVEVSDKDVAAPYKYRIVNGYHRYYASVAVGYSKLPILIK